MGKILEFSASKLDLSPSFQAGMQPPWKLVEKDDADSVRKKPDIVLRDDDMNDRVLIIDAKYTNSLGPRDYDDQTLMYALINSSRQHNPSPSIAEWYCLIHLHRAKSVAGQNQTSNIGWLKSQNEKVITKSNRSVAFPNPEQVMEWRKRDMYLSERKKMDFEAEWDLMNEVIQKSDGS